jgi:hypothetical protein
VKPTEFPPEIKTPEMPEIGISGSLSAGSVPAYIMRPLGLKVEQKVSASLSALSFFTSICWAQQQFVSVL